MMHCRKINGLYVLISIVILMTQAVAGQPDPRNGTARPMKYILQWTLDYTEPFVFWGKGQEQFLKMKCEVNECYVTSDRSLLKDITDYDAVAFHGPEITGYKPGPGQRGAWQKYVYVSIESSHNYPICDKRYDNFFNWTCTYRLDSDIPYTYISIGDVDGNIIGPSDTINWIDMNAMKPISEELKQRLSRKKKAAAWFVSNCKPMSDRDVYVKKLQDALKKYNLNIDIFGKCGPKNCPLSIKDDCFKIIETDYYFYMSMENSFSEDYVTEKLLTALQNYAIPVVFGAADYRRFMPDGIYLDATKMSPDKLAEEMHAIIEDKERYFSFFKWRNHYSYFNPSEHSNTNMLCNFCSMLHDDTVMKTTTVYPNFRTWWNNNGTTCNSGHGNISNVGLLFGALVISIIIEQVRLTGNENLRKSVLPK